MKTTLIRSTLLAGMVLAAGASAAQARTHVSIGIGLPGPVYYEPAPVYYQAAPVYYQPAPIYRTYYPVGYADGSWRHRNYDWYYWQQRQHSWRDRDDHGGVRGNWHGNRSDGDHGGHGRR